MKVSELFRKLSLGELSNLSMSQDGSGQIQESKHAQLIGYANDGLLWLYTRFILSEKDLLIEQVGHITNYHMKRQFAESAGSDEEYPYIKDLPDEPFEEDVIKILEVRDITGYAYPINDAELSNSLFTPKPDTLQVPNPRHGSPLSIVYQARHPKLFDEGDGHLDQDVELPFFLESALTNFIAYKVYSHMNGAENQAKSQEFMQTYEAICTNVEAKDTANQTTSTSHTKLEQRGFV
jgi:hypothetical protein